MTCRPQVGWQCPTQRLTGGAAVDEHGLPVGDQTRREPRHDLLLGGRHRSTRLEVTGGGRNRERPAVHSLEQAVAASSRKIAAHRVLGDVPLHGEVLGDHAPVAAEHLENLRLAL